MRIVRLAVFTLVVATVTACAGDAEVEGDAAADAAADDMAGMDHGDAQLSESDAQAVQEVRRVADGLRDLASARAAGYTSQYPEGCVQTPDGSQGFHFLNESLLDDKVDLSTPELVMYEPKADGSLELIGVDYVIPFDRWTAAEPPTVLGRPMMRNEPLGVWALHIWTHRENPSGMFAAFNPSASCDHAAAARM